jgi:SAM-dependent methyltransferase
VFSTLPVDWADYYAANYDSTLTDEGMDELVTTPSGELVFRTDLDFSLFAKTALEGLPLDAKIFEFGSGHGRILSRLRKAGYRNLYAFELGTRYREPLSRLVGPERVSIGAFPEWDEFDVVCSFFVLEHDTDPRKSLASLRRITRQGGLLYLMLPNYLTNSVDLACVDHVHHFSPDVLTRLVEAAGFEVLNVDTKSSLGAVTLLAKNSGQQPRDMAKLISQAPARVELGAALAPYFELSRRLQALPDRIELDKPLYLYGAGFYATLAHAALGAPKLAGVFDANPRKRGQQRLGCVVLDPGSIASDRYRDGQLLVCINGAVAPQICERYAAGFAQAACL